MAVCLTLYRLIGENYWLCLYTTEMKLFLYILIIRFIFNKGGGHPRTSYIPCNSYSMKFNYAISVESVKTQPIFTSISM